MRPVEILLPQAALRVRLCMPLPLAALVAAGAKLTQGRRLKLDPARRGVLREEGLMLVAEEADFVNPAWPTLTI